MNSQNIKSRNMNKYTGNATRHLTRMMLAAVMCCNTGLIVQAQTAKQVTGAKKISPDLFGLFFD
jgi:hypothetical protein